MSLYRKFEGDDSKMPTKAEELQDEETPENSSKIPNKVIFDPWIIDEDLHGSMTNFKIEFDVQNEQ
ncbi:unnamed protein product [Phyllotreta striolata]|uniref:Uncharacterized protein n=1 Tax=Phyllotreta striolata TaxID=444603 RepID=A0A9P0DRJ9_PHYSR|nr:unnamed protein product [Phyllotreta striolata]